MRKKEVGFGMVFVSSDIWLASPGVACMLVHTDQIEPKLKRKFP